MKIRLSSKEISKFPYPYISLFLFGFVKNGLIKTDTKIDTKKNKKKTKINRPWLKKSNGFENYETGNKLRFNYRGKTKTIQTKIKLKRKK